MAKKKSYKAKSKTKQKVAFAADLMRRLLLTLCAAMAVGIGGLYLYDRFSQPNDNQAKTSKERVVDNKQLPAEAEHKPASRPAKSTSKPVAKAEPSKPAKQAAAKAQLANAKRAQNDVTNLLPLPKGVELPRLRQKRTEQVIEHEGYTVSYNSDYRVANWVAYVLTDREARSDKAERQNKFVVDPMVKGASATNDDYTRTGYDRGHLAPAGDMKWSLKAMRESFYLSNVCPQKPGLNRGIWKELEELVRLWARETGAVLIATGPVIPKEDLPRLGKNRVAIPRHFYKVLCMVVDNRLEGVGFVFENRDYGTTSLCELMMPIDMVEQLTGIDFFPALPDEVEKSMESAFHVDIWSF